MVIGNVFTNSLQKIVTVIVKTERKRVDFFGEFGYDITSQPHLDQVAVKGV